MSSTMMASGTKSYILRKKGNQALLLFLPIWISVFSLMAGILIYGLIAERGRFPELWLVVLVLLATGLFTTRIWLWHLRGQEHITVHHDRIEIVRRGSFAFFTRNILTSEIDGISASRDNDTPRWIQWWGFSGGTIRIGYLGRSVRFGQDLSEKSAVQIVSELTSIPGFQPL